MRTGVAEEQGFTCTVRGKRTLDLSISRFFFFQTTTTNLLSHHSGRHDVIPIVMGAAPEDYQRAAPPHSFIHVDDFESPKELAEYLLKLDKDDTLYNSYFAWKGTGDIINTFFWCRMCALANDVPNRGPSWFEDVESWWRGPGVCIGQQTWRRTPHNKTIAGLAITLKERTLATSN